MRKSFAFLSVVPIILSCSDAWAEALNEEVIRHQSLLMLGEVTQAASVSYGYAAHTALGRSTSSKDMSEG